MQKAFKVNVVSGQKTYEEVSITDLLKKYGPETVRSFSYVCPDREKCGVEVRPGIPEKHKTNRVKTPSPYFSVRGSTKHKDGCRGDGVLTISLTDGRTLKAGFARSRNSSLMDLPVKFNDRRYAVNASKIDNDLKNKDEDGSLIHNGGTSVLHGTSQNTHASSRSTSHLSDLVQIFESHNKSDLSLQPFHLSGCPAKTFTSVFEHVEHAVVKEYFPSSKRYIYYGEVDHPREYASGFSIHFKNANFNNQPLTVWIPKNLEPASMRERLLADIKEIANGKPANLYAIGNFHLVQKQTTKFSIEIAHLNLVAISFLE